MQERNIQEVTPYDKNPRKNEKAVDKVLESLKLHGQVKPIVLSAVGHPFGQEVVCAGHTTLEALKKFGAEKVKVVVKEFKDEAEFVDYNIRDNKTGEFAEWDEAVLEELSSQFDINLKEMDFEFTGNLDDDHLLDGLTDPDDVPDAPDEPTVKLGQIWKLGEHRLMCGDSTDRAQVEALMNGEKANISFSSPPYNVGGSVDNKKGKKQMYINSDDNLQAYDNFLVNFTSEALIVSDYVFVNIQGLSNNQKDIFRYMGRMVEYLKDVFIWSKKNAPPNIQKGSFGTRFEYVFCFSKDDNKGRNFPCKWQGKHFNIIESESNLGQQETEEHRAGFPVSFPLWFLERLDFVKTLYEPFGGTGTTLIACEKTSRKCRMMELDPKYCDVIIKRFEDFTGKKAELIKDAV